MLSAYVLILTEVGKVVHVARALSEVDGVQSAEDITGPYDVIARVQAPGLDQLGRSNLDIEKHLRRAEFRLAQANAWLAMARELGWQRDDYGSRAR